MANDCGYWMKIVAKDEATLDRFAQIMTYKDPEFYVYRVFEYEETYRENVDGLVYATAYGEVAWSCYAWFHDESDRFEPEKNGARYVNLPEVCKALGIALEVWSEEFGMCFQEHGFIAKDGSSVLESKPAYSIDWEDEGSVEEIREFFEENGLDFDNAPKHDYYVGGYDDFEECQSSKELWEMNNLSE